MDTVDAEGARPEVSPVQARRALRAVTELEVSTAWRPARWAVVLLAASFAGAIAAFAWENFWFGFGALAVMFLLLWGLRGQLFNPHTRERPWQSVEHQETVSTKDRWVYGTFFVWVPTTMLVPVEPRWLGLLFGIGAGVHLYYATKDFGATR